MTGFNFRNVENFSSQFIKPDFVRHKVKSYEEYCAANHVGNLETLGAVSLAIVGH